MFTKNIFFKLCQPVYAAQTDNGIILLDAERDRYISITSKVAFYLKSALETQITLKDGVYLSHLHEHEQELFDQSIRYLLDQNFIEECSTQNTSKTLKKALEPGGLVDYRWDTKEKLISANQADRFLMLQFFFLVMSVDITLKRRDIAGVLKKIKAYKDIHSTHREPNKEDIEALSNALDRACSFYPKKMYCLAWASAFLLMALKKGYKANLVIGVQSTPFYAHAWAQVGETVVNDSAIVKSRLAVILTEPFN